VRPKFIAATLCICLCAGSGFAQSQPSQQPSSRRDLNFPPAEDNSSPDRLARDMAKKASLERATALKNDTERLLKLAEELKSYVDKSNENILSVNVIKKAEEIEKLAHSVKDKMKGPN